MQIHKFYEAESEFQYAIELRLFDNRIIFD